MKVLLNFRSDRVEASMSRAFDENTSSDDTEGPTKEESRTCIWIEEKSCDDKPLIVSTVRTKISLLPEGIVCGSGDEERRGDMAPFV